MKSVVLLSPSFPPLPGGVSDYASCLAVSLANDAYVEVITTKGLGDTSVQMPNLVVLPAMHHWTWAELPRLVRLLQSSHPDIIFLQDGKEQASDPYLLMMLPMVLRRLVGCPVVLIVHEVEGERQLFQAKTSSGVIVVEQSYVSHFTRVKCKKSICWIPISSSIPRATLTQTEKDDIRRQIGITSDSIGVGFFGFISPRKGFDVLVESLQLLDDNVHLVMIGKDADAINGTSCNIPMHTTGYLTAADVGKTLASMDINVFPFLDGARWRYSSLLAALIQDVPVVTTPGLNITLPGVFECRPKDAISLANKIKEALSLPQHPVRSIPSWEDVAHSALNFASSVH